MKQYLSNLLLAIGLFLAPIYPTLVAVGVLIMIDTITGVTGAYKQGEKITSRKMAAVLYKFLAYDLIIITAWICELHLFPQVPFIKITLAFLGITEFYSIAENFQKITGKNFLKYIRSFIEGKFKRTLEK